jgi:hypothetical protein
MTEVMRQAVTEIISNVESAKTQLNEEVQTTVEASLLLATSQNLLANVDNAMVSLGEWMVVISADASSEKSSRCKFELLHWAEKQHARMVGISLLECKQALEESVEECVLLSGQVQQLSQEKSALETQVPEIN